jgi:hypothetical protein
MTPDERQALRELATDRNANTTHYEGCWKVHWTCALVMVLDAIEPVSKRVPNQCDKEHSPISASASKSKKSSNPCNDDTHEPDESVFYTDIGWNYCPRCGKKL